MALEYDYRFKVTVVGDCSVGKSCLTLRFINDRFEIRGTTVGLDYGSRTIDLDGRSIMLQIWDTAGQESFRSLARSYLRGAACVLLAYDVSRRSSFDHIIRWLNDVRQEASDRTVIMLVANKCDVTVEEREVSFEEGQRCAEDHKLLFIETSAMTGHNVAAAFMQPVQEVYRNIQEGLVDLVDRANGITLGQRGGPRPAAPPRSSRCVC
eukprot:TRINITY_DN23160_c0_g1_i1.p1 TRINITY_DN23160_c0_g1~~TRINITY_DN23160_c0_g1_i1.p1  ORF type:complete len:209 (-),score=33.48 TRINITY_DN23160_c0_g1_i1:183-809(-)